MTSKYQEITTATIEQIGSETLKKGDKIPPTRVLSQTYHYSKDMIQRALLELKFKSYVYAANKSGYYVPEGEG